MKKRVIDEENWPIAVSQLIARFCDDISKRYIWSVNMDIYVVQYLIKHPSPLESVRACSVMDNWYSQYLRIRYAQNCVQVQVQDHLCIPRSKKLAGVVLYVIILRSVSSPVLLMQF